MAKKQARAKRRWTGTCDNETVRPKKPKLLQEALNYLAPFAHKSEANAIHSGMTVERGDEQFGISEELARQWIQHIAEGFNGSEHLALNAPRFGDLLQSKQELIEAIDNLRTKIN